MKNENNACERPPTKWEILKDILFRFIRFLDDNKVESCILFIGIGIGLALVGFSYNQDLSKILESLK